MRTIGRIEEIYIEDGVTRARVVVDGKRVPVTLTLMLNARVGDVVVVDAGLAFPKRSLERTEREEPVHARG